MKCTHCKDTGKYKMPNNVEEFERFIDTEMEKSYFVNYEIAEKNAYKIIGYTLIDCPHCNAKKHDLFAMDKDNCPRDTNAIIYKHMCNLCEFYKGFDLYNGQPCVKCAYYYSDKE